MRFFNVQSVARPGPGDRNGTTNGQNYAAAGVAPHTQTNRWTYTVPALRNAFAETFYARVLRDGAATTAGQTIASVQITPTSGVTAIVLEALFSNLNVGAQDRSPLTSQSILKAGNSVSAFTQDGSTGGTIAYVLTAKITEYDA